MNTLSVMIIIVGDRRTSIVMPAQVCICSPVLNITIHVQCATRAGRVDSNKIAVYKCILTSVPQQKIPIGVP